MSDKTKFSPRPCVDCGEMVGAYFTVPNDKVRCEKDKVLRRKQKTLEYQRSFRKRKKEGKVRSGTTNVRPCVDCGIPVSRTLAVTDDKVRCDTHRAERRREQRLAVQRNFYKKNKDVILEKREEKKQRKIPVELTCEVCGSKFLRVPREGRSLPRSCSRSCSVKLGLAKREPRPTKTHPCVDCGAEVPIIAIAFRASEVRCEAHKAEYKEKMRVRRNVSKRNKSRVELGESPYEDYVIVGPTWLSAAGSYGWRVTAKHRRNSSKREMSLAHYRMSVKEGRRLRDAEDITFLDGDIDNCDISNLQLVSNKKKEIA